MLVLYVVAIGLGINMGGFMGGLQTGICAMALIVRLVMWHVARADAETGK